MNNGHNGNRLGRATRAIHAGNPKYGDIGEVSVPIFQSSTFAFPSAEEGAARFSGAKKGYIYTRLGNPTVNALEENIADLEGGFRGLGTATGMAAVTAVYTAYLRQGAHIVSSETVYGPSRVVLETIYAKYGVEATFVDSACLDSVRRAIRPNTAMVYIETPANPTMRITDIRGAAEIAHERGIPLVVDNTFASPYLQRPFEFGADVIVHSMTKFINGHSDVVAGMIVARDEKHYNLLRPVVTTLGGTMDPHQAWLVLRGVRTLGLRVERSQENAMKLAVFLRDHPRVLWVNYPGLPDHPQHELAKKQMDGFGSMIAIGVKNGLDGGRKVMNSVRLFTLAVSLGGVESLIEHPASMTHASVSREEKEKAGITDDLVRIAVGCEDFEDLRDDLDQALRATA
jgi:methionine-gamma-lyase